MPGMTLVRMGEVTLVSDYFYRFLVVTIIHFMTSNAEAKHSVFCLHIAFSWRKYEPIVSMNPFIISFSFQATARVRNLMSIGNGD